MAGSSAEGGRDAGTECCATLRNCHGFSSPHNYFTINALAPSHLLLSITSAPPADCICIAVSHPSRLYITTDGIPTHNTTVDGEPTPASPSPDPAETQRLPSLTDVIQAGWNLTRANRQERTIDLQPVAPVAYRV